MSKRPQVRIQFGTPPSKRASRWESRTFTLPDGKIDREAFREYALDAWDDQIHAKRLEAIAEGRWDSIILAGDMSDPKMRELATGIYDEATVRTIERGAKKRGYPWVLVVAIRRDLAGMFFDQYEPGSGARMTAASPEGHFTAVVVAGRGMLLASIPDR